MALDPRIAMGGRPQNYDFLGAFDTARASEQTFQKNAMEAQRAQATEQRNAMARQRLAGLSPDDDEAFNALVAEHGDNPLVAAVGDNRNRLRDDTRAAGTARLAQEKAERDVADYTIGAALPEWVSASRNPDDATLNAAMGRVLSRPGVNADLVRQTFAPLFGMSLDARGAYMADIANSYTQSRAARDRQYPESRMADYGDIKEGLPNADPYALTVPPPARSVVLSPAAAAASERGERADARAADAVVAAAAAALQRRWDQYDEAVRRRAEAIAKEDTSSARARLEALAPPTPPSEPRPGGGGAPPTPPSGPRRYTPAQARELPSGTKFTGTDGRQYEVP